MIVYKIRSVLPNIISALVAIVVQVSFLKVWKPKQIWRFPNEPAASMEVKHHPFGRIVQAWTPFIVLTVLIGDWGISGIKYLLDQFTVKIPIAGLHNAIMIGDKPLEVIYKFNWLGAAGTAISLQPLYQPLS